MASTEKSPYKRVLLKLSGEMLLNGETFGINADAVNTLARALKGIRDQGIELGVVIGGGNIFRGVKLNTGGFARAPADQMGMLATLMNGLAIQQALQSLHCPTELLSALECPRVAETFTWKLAQNHLSSGHIVIFAGGTGNPYFTTDTAAALRASEIEADVLLKATKVSGVYNKDPIKHPDAKKYETLTYSKMLNEKLEVMDATAVAMCRSNHIPILVFDMELLKSQPTLKLIPHTLNGTLISGE